VVEVMVELEVKVEVMLAASCILNFVDKSFVPHLNYSLLKRGRKSYLMDRSFGMIVVDILQRILDYKSHRIVDTLLDSIQPYLSFEMTSLCRY